MNSQFQALGLPASPELTDDQVRAAWRRVAAATHPDRGDGGDPAAFAAAAAAYTLLRTPAGRREALAELSQPTDGIASGHPVLGSKNQLVRYAVSMAWRIRGGRPLRLAARFVGMTAVGVLAVAAVGLQPASYALIVGALTWLAVTGRIDLAPSRPVSRRGSQRRRRL